jgi:hypothetical protein
MIIVGSATPTISSGCPPITECMMPHIAVDANASTVVSVPSEKIIFYLSATVPKKGGA